MFIEGYNMDFKCLYFVLSQYFDVFFWGNCEVEKGYMYYKKMYLYIKGK